MSKKNSKMGIKLHILKKTIVFPDIFLRYSIFRFFIYYAWRYKNKKNPSFPGFLIIVNHPEAKASGLLASSSS